MAWRSRRRWLPSRRTDETAKGLPGPFENEENRLLHINRYALTTIAISIACLAPACGGEIDPLEETLASERQAIEIRINIHCN